MFYAARNQLITIKTKDFKIEKLDVQKKFFLDDQFLRISNYIESKGFLIVVPTIIDGADATWIMKQLQKENLGRFSEEFQLLIYMRLSRKDPIEVSHTNITLFV